MQIKLFVGLGNPGNEYKKTRHNFGFLVLDSIAKTKGLEFQNWNDVAAFSFYRPMESFQKIYLLKPLTYMNNSGIPISAFMRYFKIQPDEIFIFYDDFAIDLGAFRTRMSGSSAGHKGAQSIIENLKTENFARMKLGIGPLPKTMQVKDFVLSHFKDFEMEKVDETIAQATIFFDEVDLLGLHKAISRLKVR